MILSPECEAAVHAAKLAGDFLKHSFGNTFSIQTKLDQSFVSEIDKKSQEMIKLHLLTKFPKDSFIGEEGNSQIGDSNRKWIVDPLDGTNNFLLGIPHFCVSIALLENNENKLGVVYQPITDEIYIAEKNKGAFLNAKKLENTNHSTIRSLILGRYFSDNQQSITISNKTSELHRYISGFDSVRSMGAAALDVCFIASQKSLAFWQRGLQIWDIAAAELIAREAGLILVNETNQEYDRDRDSSLVCTADPQIARDLSKILSN